MKIYGPYIGDDGRSRVVIYDNGKTSTMSYPKYLMEQHLGRKLLPNEEVDHKDDDYTNNDLDNLQILTGKQNKQKEMARPERIKKYFTFTCPECGITATKELKNVNGNKNKGKAGPFCSRSCAGKYSHKI